MSLPTQTPPLLLTKRLTSFLHANRTPQLPTLLVTSPTGKLLAHASPQPVSLLRTHATVAASLLAIHTSSSPALPSALPGSRTPPTREEPEDDSEDPDEDQNETRRRGRQYEEEDTMKPATITIQLTGGIVLIRRLKCGLLFVCVGPATSPSSTTPSSGATASAAAGSVSNTTNPSGEASHVDVGDSLNPSSSHAHIVPTSPSEVDSLVSIGTQAGGSLDGQNASAAVAMRKHAKELARWLDDKLGTLAVPDDGVGVD